MNTSNVRPGGAQSSSGTERSTQAKETRKNAFAKILERKAAEKETGEPQPAPQAATAPLQNDANAPASVRSVKAPRELDGLVQEITVMLRGQEESEVRIQFDSKTLGGLSVRIAKEKGSLAVELMTRSTEVSRLLEQNAGNLAQRLEGKGYTGVTVHVRGAGAAFEASRDRRGREDRDQGGQQKQDRRR